MAGGTPSPAQADQLIIWPVSGRPTQAEPRVMPGDSATTSDISVAVFRGVAAGGGGGESRGQGENDHSKNGQEDQAGQARHDEGWLTWSLTG